MALPVNTPAESTLSLDVTPAMLRRTAETPIALTSAGNIGPGVAMQNPTMAPTESGLDAFTGAGLGTLIGLMLDRNSKPAATTSTSGLFRPSTTGTGTGTSGTGTSGTGTSGTGTSGTGTSGSGTAPTGTSGQSDTMLGGMTGNTQSITTGFLQDSSGNLYKDNGDGTASLYYEAIGNTNYIYQGPQYTSSSSGTDIYPGAVVDQQGVQVAPNWNWYVNNASDVVANTGDLSSTIGSALDWNSWYTPTDTGGSPYTPSDTTNTDYWTYIDTTGGPSWKQGGLATPLYAKGGEVKGYADGSTVTATPTSFIDTVAASAPSASLGSTTTAAPTTTSATDTTGGTSPLSSITDLLTQHSGISGAVIGALLGQLLGGKSAGNVNTGVDMSKIATIAPRTTNFGIGPTGFAPYTAYGTPTTPTTAYGGLYSNLGVSGYGSNANPLLARRISTAKSPFYTFGSPVDPSKYMAEGGSVEDEPHMADGGPMPAGLLAPPGYSAGSPMPLSGPMGPDLSLPTPMPAGLPISPSVDITDSPMAYSGPPPGYDQMAVARMYSGMSGRPLPSISSRAYSPSVRGSGFSMAPSQTYTMPYQGRAMPVQGPAMPYQGSWMPTQGPLMPRQGSLMPTQGSLMPTQGSIRYNPSYSSARSILSRYADGGEADTNVMPHNPNIPKLDGINPNVPKIGHRNDYRQGSYVEGPGDGQSDDIPAMLADGEYVIDAETVAQLGNGSNKAGAKILDKFRENIREHKRSAPHDKIPPKAKSALAYLKGAK